MSVAKLEQIRPHVAVLTVDNDWLVRDRGRRELEKVDHALAIARKREKSNPWPFSRPDARRTTPATGGIAHHMAKAGKRGTAGPVDSGTHKGYKISRTSDGEFFSSLDPQSWFETKRQTKEHIDRYLKGRANPGLRFSAHQLPNKEWRIVDNEQGDEVRTVKTRAAAVQAVASMNARNSRFTPSSGRRRRNPAAASADVFEEFHGFKPSEVVTVTKHVHHHEHLAALGKLVLLEVYGVDKQGHKISGFKNAILACNEDRNQLFIEGGDQTVDLSDFGISKGHETETLGKVTNIGYQTNKTHLGDEGGNAVYVHKFRSTNQGGKHVTVKIARCPDLIYDVRNEQLLFSGGSYEILAEGINK
jgi:hypothetical protein